MGELILRPESLLEDQTVILGTNEFRYRDGTVQLELGGKIYEVSRSRLILRSNLFKDLFQVPQAQEFHSAPIPMAGMEDSELRSFLWFTHADPISAEAFLASPASADKCARLLGIATVAHRYDAMDIAQWAVDKALAMLMRNDRAFPIDVELSRLLVSIASRWQEDSLGCTVTSCRDVVCDALSPTRPGPLSFDPLTILDVARNDQFVLAHVYFYVLRKGYDYNWRDDARVQPVDRRRLLCGAYSLQLGRSTPWPAGTFPSSKFDFQTAGTFAPPGMTSASASVSSAPSKLRTLTVARGSTVGPFAPPVGTASAAPPSSSALERATDMPWRPEVDWQIGRAREELWTHFDDEKWALLPSS